MQKPKAGLLSPKVAELVADLLAEVDREDPVPVAEYIEMIQSSPIVGAAIELKALAGIEKLGTYSNPEQSYQDFILKCFEVMDGSLPLSVMELLSVGPIGYATSEWAPIQRDKQWVLDRIQIIDPRRYTFRGKSGNIESVVYEGDRGNIEIPYDRVIHIVNQRHIAFGSVYGVAECKRGYTAYKAWKIALAAAIIAAKRRGEPILVGFADPGETVQIGTNADGSIASVSGTQALADSLKELENNSVAATSLANRIQTIEAADGALIMAVLALLEKYQLLAFLVPESVLTATGVGDSNLNKGQRSTLDASIDAAMNQIKERIIEDVVRPLLIWEFGEGVEDFGEFVSPKAPEEGALETLRALTDAILNNIFSASDLDVINRLRELAGLPSVTEIAQGLEPPIDDESIDSEVVEDEGDGGTLPSLDDIAATFAARRRGRRGGRGKKNCEKGLNCGGTCISSKKTCIKDMTPEQKALHRKAKRAAGGGGGATEEEAPRVVDTPPEPPVETPAPTPPAEQLDPIEEYIRSIEATDPERAAQMRDSLRQDLSSTQTVGAIPPPRDVDQLIASGDLPRPQRKGAEKLEFDEIVSVDRDDFVSIKANAALFGTLNEISIAFNVNGSYAAGDISNPKVRLKAAIVAKDALRAKFRDMPDGQILVNSPYDGDGNGAARRRIYAKAGFGPMDPDTGLMYAVVKDGKLLPLNGYDEAQAYHDSNAKAPRNRKNNA